MCFRPGKLCESGGYPNAGWCKLVQFVDFEPIDTTIPINVLYSLDHYSKLSIDIFTPT